MEYIMKIIFDKDIFKLWYLSCVKWEKNKKNTKHYYHIKYATSLDGINWNRKNQVAIDFLYKNEYAISVPRVIIEDCTYKMWYSYRGGPYSEKYRIGYAESSDGILWNRKDDIITTERSNEKWDSDMICYPYIFNHQNEKYMLYNGNDYGKTGIGLLSSIAHLIDATEWLIFLVTKSNPRLDPS